jgi:hypothetical protein
MLAGLRYSHFRLYICSTAFNSTLGSCYKRPTTNLSRPSKQLLDYDEHDAKVMLTRNRGVTEPWIDHIDRHQVISGLSYHLSKQEHLQQLSPLKMQGPSSLMHTGADQP